MGNKPKWITPRRQYALAQIALDYYSISGWKVDFLTGEYFHPDFERRMQNLIDGWKQDDREDRYAQWICEYEARHKIHYRLYPIEGKFSGVSKDIYYDSQPLFYLEAIGISPITFKPVAKLRLASTEVRLFVDIGDRLQSMSKHQKRKVVRYGEITTDLHTRIYLTCYHAVRQFLANPS